MIVATGKDVLRHDFHTHSIQSKCGMHTILEILDIAAQKGAETVNVCDHGKASGRNLYFGVVANRKRTPMDVRVSIETRSADIRFLPGIEANILDGGETDLNLERIERFEYQFSLINAGFHSSAEKLKQWKNPHANFEALSKYVEKYPLDILTHPCIKHFPFPIEDLVKLAKENHFALEVNNTNLVLKKTDLELVRQMIEAACTYGVTLLCNSDGHTWHELFECGAVRSLVEGQMNLIMEDVFPMTANDGWHSFCIRSKQRCHFHR